MFDFIYNVGYEILLISQRGVLPIEVLINTVIRDSKYINRRYRIHSDFNEFFKSNEFDDTDSTHWEIYYSSLIKLGLKHDVTIIEHMYGIFLITRSRSDRNTMQFSKSLIPLRIDNENAKSARRRGLNRAERYYNQTNLIVTS